MSGAFLYTDPNGRQVTRHSYSAGADFRKCARFYLLKRVRGWREKEKRASLEFGKQVESAIQFFHANKTAPGSGVAEFKRLWLKFEKMTDLVYTEKEGDWADLYKMGSELLALYELKWPTFGYRDPVFQLNYRKPMFSGTELDGIEQNAYVDMRAEFLRSCSEEPHYIPIVIDIKTSAASLPEDENMLVLDPQLREYAWITGIPNVAFLNLIKTRPGLKKGDEVTVLVGDDPEFPPGSSAIVLRGGDEDAVILLPSDYENFEKESAGLKGGALEKKKNEFASRGPTVPTSSLTKQRIQFLTARIPDEDILEVGQEIGQQIAEIVAAKSGTYPKSPGIRFPDNKCTFCIMRGICTKNNALRDELLLPPESASPVEDML